MTKYTLHEKTVECLQGNIVRQPDMEAIVNAANAELRIGGGVAGAIHQAAGPELEKECLPLAPIKVGEAVITGAHKLPNSYVIHCLGPVYGRDEPSDKLLAGCYQEALKLSEENKIKSIAFPAISTGAFGYPLEDAARLALETVAAILPRLAIVNHIRFVLFSEKAAKFHDKVLREITA